MLAVLESAAVSPFPRRPVGARFVPGLGAVVVCLLSVLTPATAARAPVQGVESFLSAMVQIVATRNGETLRGSGFIVALDKERGIATVATSAHVVEGAKFEAILSVDPAQPLPTEIVNLEAENRNGLALFRVRNVPATATAREVAGWGTPAPRPAQSLTLIGYPNTSSTPLARSRAFSGQDGALYVIDLGVGEGTSGGPVLLDSKVVGLITATTAEQTYAVPFPTLRTFLEGSRVALAGPSPTPDSGRPAAPSAPPPATKTEPPAATRDVENPPAPDAAAIGTPGSAMVRLTGTVDGRPFQASGFVVAIRPENAEVYIATTLAVASAGDLQVAFAVDRAHTFPARVTKQAFSENRED